jgi:protein involved in polysaccharide export with SLBB domain
LTRAGVHLVVGLVMVGLLAGCQSVSNKPLIGSQYENMANLASVYAVDFDDGKSDGWRQDDPPSWSVAEGHYRAKTKGDQASESLYEAAEYSNVFFAVDYLHNVTSGGSGGAVVRASRDFHAWTRGSGYLFALGSDGVAWSFAVYIQRAGVIEYLQPWSSHAALQRSDNRLAVLAQDDLLQFYINGDLVWEGRDGNLTNGLIGLLGSTSEGEETSHDFDGVVVKTVKSLATGAEPSKIPATARQPGGSRPAQDKSPVMRPGYLVQVSVLASGKREVDAQVIRVSDNNQLDLPLIGPVSVKGMTLSELNEKLQKRYKEFFIEPQVLAEFVVEDRPDAISPWGSVVVLGRVRTPGRVNIPPTQDLTVSGAIQQAGGLDTSAKSSAIRLTRRQSEGKTERISIDFTAIGEGKVENDLLLQAGDVIFVPERVF